MRVVLARRFGASVNFIVVLEFQKSGLAHLHVLLGVYIPQAWLSEAWQSIGGGRIVDIRFVDVHRVAGYLACYLKGVSVAIGRTAQEQQQLAYAKTAASGAYAAVAGVPLIGPVLAPIAAAAAFAGALAFEKGGIMPEDGGAILHKNEMVLPPHISDFVQKAASAEPPSDSTHNFHYTANVNAIDRNGVEDALRDHADVMFDMWKQQMRNRNY